MSFVRGVRGEESLRRLVDLRGALGGFRQSHSDPGQTGHAADRFGSGDSDPYGRRTGYGLDYGVCDTSWKRSEKYYAVPYAVYSALRGNHGAVLALLFPGLQQGEASVVVPIDKLSILVTICFRGCSWGNGWAGGRFGGWCCWWPERCFCYVREEK